MQLVDNELGVGRKAGEAGCIDVLVVDGDEVLRGNIVEMLPAKWRNQAVGTPEHAESILDAWEVKVLLCSDELPGETGLMFLARTKERWPRLRRILLAADLDGELFFHAMREVSIFDYLTKPVVPGELATAVARARMQYDAAERLAAERAGGSGGDAFLSVAETATVKSWPRDGALVVCGFAAGVLATLVLLMCLYFIKTLSGMDIDPTMHFWDFFEL